MPYVVPYAPQERYAPNGRLVDLIRAQGQDAARAAELRGQQQAQLWGGIGNTIGNVANSVIQAPAEIAKAQLLKAQADRVGGENADANALRSGQRTVDTMMAGDQLPAGDAGPRMESYLTADGLYDVPRMNAALSKSGLAHLAPELLKGAESINDSITKHQTLEQQANVAHAVMLGDMADGALKLNKIGMPLTAAIDFVAQAPLASKRITPQDLSRFKAQINGLPPEQQVAAVQSIMDQAAKLAPTKTLAKDATEVDRFGRSIASNVVPEKPTKDTIAMDAATLGKPNETPTAKQSAIALGLLTPQAHGEVREGFVIKGTTNVPTYHPDTDSWSFANKPVASDQVVRAAAPKDPVAAALQQIALQTAQEKLTDSQRRNSNVAAIARGMKNGTIPPDPEGLSRQGIYADVIGQMAREGVDFTELRKNYLAAKRLIVTENSPQSNRLDTAVRSGLKMYDAIDSLSSQWDGMGLGPLSRANLKLAMEGAKGRDAANLAIQLNGQIAQLTSDVATVEQNGMTPTQESRKVAEQSMQSWWGDDTIHKMTAQGRANMRIRETARNESVPLVPGQAPAAKAQPAATGATYKLVNGQWVKQ